MISRVAYITTPYHGHASVLLPLWQSDPRAHLFIVRFKDDPQLEVDRQRVTIITDLQPRDTEVAHLFNAKRKRLENVLRCFLHDFNPTLVVYDYFCLEGREACRHLGIPAICSIAAMLKEKETETCSDALLPSEHYYWLWKHPYPVSIAPVAFLGPRQSFPQICVRGSKKDMLYDAFFGPPIHISKIDRFAPEQEEIWICFGTVVPRYPGCQKKLEAFLEDFEDYAKNHQDKTFVLFNLANTVMKRFAHVPNVRVMDYCDLMQELSAHVPRILIFHGGGNTFTEAFHYRIPYLLVVPFFGDQFEVAKRTGNEYSGDLAHDMQHLQPMKYEKVPPLDIPFQDSFEEYFRPGDLVFGQRKNRDALQAAFPQMDLHLNHYASFELFAQPDRGDLPAIADVYNDGFAKFDFEKEPENEYERRMHDFKQGRSHWRKIPDGEHKLVYYCLDLMRLTTQKWGGKIHFILGEEPGIATDIELKHVLEYWERYRDVILFYNTQGCRIPVPFFLKNRKQRPAGEKVILDGERDKTRTSIMKKQEERNLPVLDAWAVRTGYVTLPNFTMDDFDCHVQTCDLRVHYFYRYALRLEMQLWPWIYLHNYEQDVKRGVEEYFSDRERQRRAQDVLEGIEI